MYRRDLLGRLGATTAATLTGGGIGTAAAAGGDSFRAGAVRNNVTPRSAHLQQGVYLGGFGLGPQRKAEGVHDGCYARALAVSVDGTTVVFAMLDAVGVGNRVLETIRTRVAARADVDPAHLLIGTSHSHSGPDFQGLWGGVSADYEAFVVDQMVDAIAEAVDSRREATAVVGQVDSPELSTNRRGWDSNTDVVNALQFAHRGEAIGTLATYAAHPTEIGSSNQLVATDYVGPLERELEAEYGGVGIFFPEAIGDASTSGSSGETGYEEAVDYGEKLAARVDRALDDAEAVTPSLAVRTGNVRLPMDSCIFRVAYESGLLRRYYEPENLKGNAVATAGLLAGGIDPAAERALDEFDEATPGVGALGINTPVSRVSLGSATPVEMVTVPGEAVTRLARDLIGIMGGEYNVLLGLTQNTLGYFVRREEWGQLDNRTYEETVSLGPDTAPIYRSAVEGLFDAARKPVERTPRQERTCPTMQLLLESEFGSLSQGEWLRSVDSVDGIPIDRLAGR